MCPPYELLDNENFGTHQQALEWLMNHYRGPLSIATGYLDLQGLNALAKLAAKRQDPTRLLLGAVPEALSGSPGKTIADRFEQSVAALRRERDFSAFPAARRAVLEQVAGFIASDGVQVRRYIRRFLHGKAYMVGQLDNYKLVPEAAGPGAALISSANLTQGGLVSNLELGLVHYQPNVVGSALDWFQRLWDEAEDYREELLELLRPPALESDPQDVFLRALLELYGGELEEEAPTLPEGNILTAFQRDGLARAKRILNQHNGVLYADGVGMGKTEIGVQLIREYVQDYGGHVLVVSPAPLRDGLWKDKLAKANLPGTVVSYQELAQDQQLSDRGRQCVLPVNKDVYRLVVVDEAHAYRNADNTWYAALHRLMGGTPKKLLLLTATPVNNSLWDLHNLFLLFCKNDAAFCGEPLRIPSLRKFFSEAGAANAVEPSETKLFPLMDALTVRRDRAFITKYYRGERFTDGTPVQFPKPELKECRYNLDEAHPGLVQAIHDGIDKLTMARYRISAYKIDGKGELASEEALAGLVRSQLLKRFESSWWAALQTVERMHKSNELLLTAIAENGVVMSAKMVKELVDNCKEDDEFLNDKLLEEAFSKAEDQVPAHRFNEQLQVDLKNDLDILAHMAATLKELQGQPDPKLKALTEVMRETPARKVAIFTAYQDTANYLKEQIHKQEKISRRSELLNQRSWTAVIGSESSATARAQAIERFCPDSGNDKPGSQSPDDEVDVLLSTDVLSEGQNLQQAQAVLSFDMPWNPQRVVQRNGRVIRLRSPHDTAYLYTLLPAKGDLDKLLKLEAKLQAKIRAANAAVGTETPVLADMAAESQAYADLNSYFNRLADGDSTLLDEKDREGKSSAFAGELFRSQLRRAIEEGEIHRLQQLPWGIGAAFIQRSPTLTEPAVFFACRTRHGERYWRMVSQSGKILHRDDLPMLELIDPQEQPGNAIPSGLDLEKLFALAADDICKTHTALSDSGDALPASQRWALDILRLPDAPAGKEFDDADAVLSVGRSNPVRRELSAVRQQHGDGNMSVTDCAQRIVKIVADSGLQPVHTSPAPEPITTDDLGVVCYQVVMPQAP